MRLLERIATWFDDWKLPGRSGIDSDGTDINPATGLPTLAGAGTPDVVGNPYGSTRPHDYESDCQRHDRWDSSAHDHFQHYDSWSASSHDPWRD
jgi:hypothetical protein